MGSSRVSGDLTTSRDTSRCFWDPRTTHTRPTNWYQILTQICETIEQLEVSASGARADCQGSGFPPRGVVFLSLPVETERDPPSFHSALTISRCRSSCLQSGWDRGEHRDFTINRCNFAERFTKIRIELSLFLVLVFVQ